MTTIEEGDELARAGIFRRIVTHEQALEAAKNFIDAHFKNKDGRGVLTSVPARPYDDDVTLVDYIKQQRARSQHNGATQGDKVDE